MNMRLVRANDRNNTRVTIILVVFYKEENMEVTYSKNKYNILTYFLSVINVCRYCIQLLIVIIKHC